MAEAQLRQFLDKVRQLNAFVAMSEADPRLRQELCDCEHHDQVVALARRCGFEIGRRWGEPPAQAGPATTSTGSQLHRNEQRPSQEALPADSARPVPQPPAPETGSVQAAPQQPEAKEQRVESRAFGVSRSPAQRSAAGAAVSGDDLLRSLLKGRCPPPGEECTEVLLETPLWRLERIHSCACRSPEGFWYDQQEEEWVLLLQGQARLCFEGPSPDAPAGEHRLLPGDSLWIRAGQRHRVTATDPAPGTIWLALFWRQT